MGPMYWWWSLFLEWLHLKGANIQCQLPFFSQVSETIFVFFFRSSCIVTPSVLIIVHVGKDICAICIHCPTFSWLIISNFYLETWNIRIYLWQWTFNRKKGFSRHTLRVFDSRVVNNWLSLHSEWKKWKGQSWTWPHDYQLPLRILLEMFEWQFNWKMFSLILQMLMRCKQSVCFVKVNNLKRELRERENKTDR